MRIDELDSLRATALVMMLVLNFVTDLNHFGIMNTETGDQWWWLARIAASLFVGISGVSYFLAHRLEYDFTKTSGRTKRLIFWAFVITIRTYIFEPSAYVRFGVLHLLALASIVAFPVARKPEFALGIGLILLILMKRLDNQLNRQGQPIPKIFRQSPRPWSCGQSQALILTSVTPLTSTNTT